MNKLGNNIYGGACNVMVIVLGNGYGDWSSNTGSGSLHFQIKLIFLGNA